MKYAIVPIKLDALFVHSDEYAVLNQVADFSKLPYVSSELGDVNADTANISEMVLNQSFAAKNLRLGNGLHLHWALPDALTRGEEGEQDMTFPSVPDRWLVNRYYQGTLQKQWVVESNYLFPEGINRQGSNISIPFGEGEQSYRFMGRQMPLSVWNNKNEQGSPNDRYYEPLTAMGYGEATFAAYYPNCFSVFGCYDKEVSDINGISYQVIGWYENPADDMLSQLLEKEQVTDLEGVRSLLLEEYDWQLDIDAGVPEAMLCYAKLQFAEGVTIDYSPANATPKITVANTATEALSASLADKLKEHVGDDPEQALKRIEDQLEAVQLSYQLGSKSLDVMSRFRELRHENGFTAHPGGYFWTVGFEKTGAMDEEATQSPLSETLSEIIARVNQLQRAYNKAEAEIGSIKLQLFADWYKYMIAKYPPDRLKDDYPAIDEIRLFIEKKTLVPLQGRMDDCGTLTIEESENGEIIGFNALDSLDDSIAFRLAVSLRELATEIASLNQQNNQKGTYYLKQIPAPRFWECNDPVVLLDGDSITGNDRNGQDKSLPLLLFQPSDKLVANHFDELLSFLAQQEPSFGLRTFTQQPWNPFLLEWSLQYFPLESKGNASPDKSSFDEDYITYNYESRVTSHDLLMKQGKGKISRKGSLYQGSSILTSQANGLLNEKIQEHLEKQGVLAAYSEEQNVELDLETDIDDVLSWYSTKPSEQQKPGILIQLMAFQLAKRMTCLSQSIGGLNEAMLMTKQTMELAVGDPLAFGDKGDITGDKYFSDEWVNKVIGENLVNAPAPMNEFHPVRAGAIRFDELRLIDTFGQVKELSCERIDTTYKMTVPGNHYLVQLPPRIVQPARLDFRWLNSIDSQSEMEADKGDHPICGWLLTNKLDKSLMVFDDEGQALGYFQSGLWREAVGSTGATTTATIENEHLRRMVRFIEESIDEDPERENEDIDQRFLSQFIATVDDALDNIQPESGMQQSGFTMLLGRPVALVRARLSLELQGLPAVNQKWEAFRHDLDKNSRTTDDFTNIKFPVRIGEYGQMNDGLVGYWLENHEGQEIEYQHDIFYSPQSDVLDSDRIESQYNSAEGPINFLQSIDEAPQFLSILLDPLGTLHATVGVLPNKEISIPENTYADALSKIEMTFLTAPVLTDQGRVQLPLPKDDNYTWSWLERSSYLPEETWSEIKSVGEIGIEDFDRGWSEYGLSSVNYLDMWNHLLLPSIKWIIKSEQGSFRIADRQERAADQFSGSFGQLEGQVQAVLDVYARQIEPVDTEANFTGQKEIKEGWLKLKANTLKVEDEN